jgi:hypothetical protein
MHAFNFCGSMNTRRAPAADAARQWRNVVNIALPDDPLLTALCTQV